MNNFRAFLGKELMENLRTKRLLVMLCVFLFFAISSPLLARYMGELFALLLPGEDEMSQSLLAIMGEPVWMDSYGQLYANLGQLGALTVLLLYMGSILREKRDGSADLVFTKGLGSGAFVLAKFTVAGALTLGVTLASVLVGYIYTLLLFGYGGNIIDVLLGGLAFGAFLLMLLAVTLLCSAVAKSTAVSAVLGLSVFFLLIFISALPRIGRFSPGNLLASGPFEITLGHSPDGFAVMMAITIAITVISLWAAAGITAKKSFTK